MNEGSEQQGVPAGEPPQVVEKSLGAVLLSDANTIVVGSVVGSVTAVAGVVAHKILNREPGGKDQGDSGTKGAAS